tara:strand:- start:240 stop:596 length:357 start_codon:yes stop_codon:yes gene_type:complete
MSDEEYSACSMCDESFQPDKHEYFCNECSESTITLWTCQRCDNTWSPDYCNEAMYSDCCHPMMEGYEVDIDSIKFCVKTWETVWDDDKFCRRCDESEEKCENILKAYKSSECKLMEYC